MAIRSPASWMQSADDRVLEFLESEGAASITTIDESEFVNYHYNTISRRCRMMLKVGLVERLGEGVYRITPKGTAYLAGQEDLRDEPEPE